MAQNWVRALDALLYGIRQMLDGGTLLVDGDDQPREYSRLNAVYPLRAVANQAESRFDLSIEPTALIPDVPCNDTAFVDVVNGNDLTAEVGQHTLPFATPEAAIEAVNALMPSSTNPMLISVQPGVYSITPLMLSPWVSLVGTDGPDTVIFQASDTGEPMVTGSDGSSISGISLLGANQAGGAGLRMDTAGSFGVFRCRVIDCKTGVVASGVGSEIVVDITSIDTGPTETMDAGILAEAGGVVQVHAASVSGLTGHKAARGIMATGAGSIVNMGVFGTVLCEYGLYATNGGTVIGSNGNTLHCEYGYRVALGVIEIGSSVISQSEVLDLYADTPNGTLITSGVLTEKPPVIVSGASYFGTRLDQGTQQLVVEGSASIGAPGRPAVFAAGAGGFHTSGMVALQNDNGEAGTWTDVTASLASPTGSINAFSANLVNASLYIGGDSAYQTLRIATSLAKSGTVVAEYWDGAVWTTIPRWMTTEAVAPYASSAQALMSATGTANMRLSTLTGWAAKTLDGKLKTYLRFRISGAPLAVMPKLTQVQLGTSHTRINTDGVIEHFGDARPDLPLEVRRGIWSTGSGGAPTVATVSYSANVSAAGSNFTNAVQRFLGLDLVIPRGLDTSAPITFAFEVYSSNTDTGIVDTRLYYVRVPPSSLLTGALSGEQLLSLSQAAPGVAGQAMPLAFSVSAPTVIAGVDRVALTFTRLATDAHTGDIILVNVRAAGRRWRD